MTREELLSHVQSNMSDKRYQHCLRVERKILELANLYGVDEKQLRFVGLTHDYAKEIPVDKQQALAKEIGPGIGKRSPIDETSRYACNPVKQSV